MITMPEFDSPWKSILSLSLLTFNHAFIESLSSVVDLCVYVCVVVGI